MVGVRDDILFLERMAQMAETDQRPEDAKWLRDIGDRQRNPQVEVVEQGSLVRTGPTIRSGWSWSDAGPFRGYYDGIRLQMGEPFVEQGGHMLFLRQGETSLTDRQRSIYERCSTLALPITDALGETAWHPCVSVLVVFGFQGKREGLLWFRRGKEEPIEMIDGPEAMTDSITAWLKWAVANRIFPDDREFRKGPRAKRLPGM